MKRQKKTMAKPQTTLVVEVPLKEVLDEIRQDIKGIHDVINKKADKSEIVISDARLLAFGERLLKLESGGAMAEDIRKQWKQTNWQWVTILVALAGVVAALLKH